MDNVVPYIGGEEEKSEREPMKLWGRLEGGVIVNAGRPAITTQCIRVPVSDGHMAAVFASFDRTPSMDEILDIWKNYKGRPQELALPPRPNSSCATFPRITVPKRGWTAIWRVG